ncbi:MAG: M48 family metalloprotease [Fulvivirga sp.]|nr:M48 family metalloprotease [Fulvivirga sp.]
MRKYICFTILSGIIIIFNNCATNPVTGKKNLMLLSEKQEIAMGKEADPDIVAFFGLYEDQELQNFISHKGKEMARISHRPDLPYEFKIVDSPVVNAFAVPGGFVYFTRGIMAHFSNEAEFAGVLGHEIGHITARHSARQYSKAMVAQAGMVAGSVFSETFAQYANVAGQGIGLLFLKFGRDYERQSDKLGVEYSSKIGYNSYEMASFFQTLDRMRQQSGSQIPTFLSSHPDPADREEAVRKYTEKWQSKLNLTSPEINRVSYLKLIDGMVYGEDPRQGFVENNHFYHPELKFKFLIPEGWRTQNSPQQFQMAEPNGKALMMLTLSSASTLQEAAQNHANKYQLEVVDTSPETVNGLPAIAQIADQNDENDEPQVRTITYFIAYNNNIYVLLGASSYDDFNLYADTFVRTMEDFSVLSDPDKINRQPTRIDIREISYRTTLAKALENAGMPTDKFEELAVLNGMQLDEQLPEGTLIKVLENP